MKKTQPSNVKADAPDHFSPDTNDHLMPESIIWYTDKYESVKMTGRMWSDIPAFAGSV